MPGDEQQEAEAGELLDTGAGCQLAAQDVVAGLLDPRSHELADVGLQVAHRLHPLLHRRVDLDEGRAVDLEEVVVLVGHPEKLGDHDGGHRQRERGHEVGLGARCEHRVDRRLDDLHDARPHRGDLLDGELPHHPHPLLRVVGRVHLDELLQLRGTGVPPAVHRVPGQGAIRAESGIAEHRTHVGVLGDRPHGAAIRQLHLADRILLLLQADGARLGGLYGSTRCVEKVAVVIEFS